MAITSEVTLHLARVKHAAPFGIKVSDFTGVHDANPYPADRSRILRMVAVTGVFAVARLLWAG